MTVHLNSPAPAFELSGELCPVGWRPGEPIMPPIRKNTGK